MMINVGHMVNAKPVNRFDSIIGEKKCIGGCGFEVEGDIYYFFESGGKYFAVPENGNFFAIRDFLNVKENQK